jgi:chromosome segregation ATPase
MEALVNQLRAVEGRSAKDTDREELQSALNRMMEAASSWKRERAQLVAACDQLRRQLNDRGESVVERPQQSSSLPEGPAAWHEERNQLLSELDQLRTQLNESQEGAGIALERQISRAVERVRSEFSAENSKLREELQRAPEAAAQWAAERNQILTELERTTQLLAEAEEAAAIALDRQIASAVKRAREEWSGEEQKLREEIRTLQERGAASVSSEQVTDAVESARKEWIVERDRMRQELDAAMHLCARRGAEFSDLATDRDRLRQSLAEAESERVALAGREVAAAENLQKEIAVAVERVRAELEAEKEQLLKEAEDDLGELLTELDETKAMLTEAQSAYSIAVSELKEVERKSGELLEERDRLREQVEQVTDVAAQKELERLHLKEEFDRTSQILDEAKAVRQPGEGGVTSELVLAEEVRVEEVIRELSALIDDPATELSAVIRKTVERAQLDFYLKGLRFSATGESPSTP